MAERKPREMEEVADGRQCQPRMRGQRPGILRFPLRGLQEWGMQISVHWPMEWTVEVVICQTGSGR